MTYRWLDAEHTMVRRESDGAVFAADSSNRDYADCLAAGAAIAPYQRWAGLAEAQADLVAAVEARARAMRMGVAGASDATKLAIYREKYATAIAALANDAAAIAALTPEASARGEDAATLARLVKSLGDQWRAAGLAIDAAYQTHKRAIAGLATLDAAAAYDIDAGWPL